MSVAAMSAVALRELLAEGGLHAGFAAEAQALGIARSADVAWMTAVSADRVYVVDAETVRRGAAKRLQNWYFGRLAARVVVDPVVAEAFRDLVALTASPSRLLAPGCPPPHGTATATPGFGAPAPAGGVR